MTEWNYFYGAILIEREYEKSTDFILNGILEKKHFYFHPSLFSTGTLDNSYFYEDFLFSFGRTVKNFIYETYELQNFIIEFENILDNLDFTNAQIKINRDYFRFDLFWLNKLKLSEKEIIETVEHFKKNEVKYFESEKFFLGLGEVDLQCGMVLEKSSKEKNSSFEHWYPDFKYPF